MTTENGSAAPVTKSLVQELLVTRTGADPEIFEHAGGQALEELGIDSLAVLELTAVMQEEYSLDVPEDALQMSVDQIVTHLNFQAARA
ncbi:MAG TPA: acyl carrier protein [Streptosporangiaceae bacterium]|jgi:acyl carrier protein